MNKLFRQIERLIKILRQSLKNAKNSGWQFLVKKYKTREFLLSYRIHLVTYKLRVKLYSLLRAPSYRFKLMELWMRLRFFDQDPEESSVYNSSPERITQELYESLDDSQRSDKNLLVVHLSRSFHAPFIPLFIPPGFQWPPTFILGRLNYRFTRLVSRRFRHAMLYHFRSNSMEKESPEIVLLTIKGSYKKQTMKRIINLTSFNKFFATTNGLISSQIRSQELYWHRQATPYADFVDSHFYFKDDKFGILQLFTFIGKLYNTPLKSFTNADQAVISLLLNPNFETVVNNDFGSFFWSFFANNSNFILNPKVVVNTLLYPYITFFWLQRFLRKKSFFRVWIAKLTKDIPNHSITNVKQPIFLLPHPYRHLNELHQKFAPYPISTSPINVLTLASGGLKTEALTSNYIFENQVASTRLNLFSLAPERGFDDPILFRRSFRQQFMFWFLVHRGSILMYVGLYRFIHEIRSSLFVFYQKYVLGDTIGYKKDNYWLMNLGPLVTFRFNGTNPRRILPVMRPQTFTLVAVHDLRYRFLTTKIRNLELNYVETSFFPIVVSIDIGKNLFKLPQLQLAKARYSWYRAVLIQHNRTVSWDEYVYGMWFTRTKPGFQSSEIDYSFNRFYRAIFELPIITPHEELRFGLLPGNMPSKKLTYTENYRVEMYYSYNETSHLFFDWLDYATGQTPRYFFQEIYLDPIKMENADWVFPLPFYVIFDSWATMAAYYIVPFYRNVDAVLPEIYFVETLLHMDNLEHYWMAPYTRDDDATTVFDVAIDVSTYIVWQEAQDLIEDRVYDLQNLTSISLVSALVVFYSYFELAIFKIFSFLYFFFRLSFFNSFSRSIKFQTRASTIFKFISMFFVLGWPLIICFFIFYWLFFTFFGPLNWIHITQFAIGTLIIAFIVEYPLTKFLDSPIQQQFINGTDYDDDSILDSDRETDDSTAYFIGFGGAVGFLATMRPAWPFDLDNSTGILPFFYKGGIRFTIKMVPNRAQELKWFWFRDPSYFSGRHFQGSIPVDLTVTKFFNFGSKIKNFQSLIPEQDYVLHLPFIKFVYPNYAWFPKFDRDGFKFFGFRDTTDKSFIKLFRFNEIFYLPPLESFYQRTIPVNYGTSRSTALGSTRLAHGVFGPTQRPSYTFFATTAYSHPNFAWYDLILNESKHHMFIKQLGLRQKSEYEMRRVYVKNAWERAYDLLIKGKKIMFVTKQKNYSNFLIPAIYRKSQNFNPFLGDYTSLMYYSSKESQLLMPLVYKLLGYSGKLITKRDRPMDINITKGSTTLLTATYQRKSAIRIYMGPLVPLVEYNQISWMATHQRRRRRKNSSFNKSEFGEYIFTCLDERHFLGGYDGVTAGNLPEPIFSQWRGGSARGSAFNWSLAANTLENSKPFSTSRNFLRFLAVLGFFKLHFLNVFGLEKSDSVLKGQFFSYINAAVGNNYASITYPLPFMFDFTKLDSYKTPRFTPTSFNYLRYQSSDRIVLTRGFNLSIFDKQAAIVPNYYYARRPSLKNWSRTHFLQASSKKSNSFEPYIFSHKKKLMLVDKHHDDTKYFFIPSFLRTHKKHVWPIVQHSPIFNIRGKAADGAPLQEYQSKLSVTARKDRIIYYRLWWAWAKEPKVAHIRQFFFKNIVLDSTYSQKYHGFYINYSALHRPFYSVYQNRFRVYKNWRAWVPIKPDWAVVSRAKRKKRPFYPPRWIELYYDHTKYASMNSTTKFYRDPVVQHNVKWYQTGAHKILGGNYTINSRNFQARNFLTESVFGSLDQMLYGWDYTFVLVYLQFERNFVHLLKLSTIFLDAFGWTPNYLCAIESDWFLPVSQFWIF